MSNNTEKIKDRLNIVDVVGSYIKLNKAGINLKAQCPFHNEKTPSFFVSPDRGTYKCFGCGAGGDIFTFIEQFEGVDFPGALNILAERAGIELVKEDPRIKDERNRLYGAMEDATVFFEKKLENHTKAQEYLKGRGLKQETIKKFRIGFIENEWRNLYEFLKEKKYTDEEIEKVGLAKRTEKGFYDRFRGRIVFPIFDNTDRVVGFSGRLFEDDGKSAKYLNSPETVLFNKSKILYGYNFAKNDIRKRDFSILVEGQMDLIMAHQSGFTNAVATSGTSLTSEHVPILKRLSNKMAIAYDGDKAGLAAANRGAKLALATGMDVKFVEIPTDSDPADFILKDRDGWVDALRNSVHIIDFNLNYLIKKEGDNRQLGIKVREIILPLVKGIESKIEQNHFVLRISSKTDIPEDIIWEDLEKVDEEVKQETDFVKNTIGNGQKKELSVKQKAMREISGAIYWQKTLEEPELNIDKVESNFNDIIGDDVFEKITSLSEAVKNEIIFEAENLYLDAENLDKKMEELLLKLEKEKLKEERDILKKKIDKGDSGEEDLIKYKELSKKIETTNKS